jgi:small-conductance mechanosensitive channel
MERYIARQVGANNKAQASASATLLSWGLRTVLWAVVLLAVLSNMGVNVTAFVASLGVGGIAVALAVQNILGDLFASLSIAVDKPFEVGDSIAVQNFSGTVEHIGLKTTRIRSLGGEQIVISNTDLLKQPVRNYKRMTDRRIEFKFSISNDTTPEQAEAIPALVKRLVEASDQLRFDRAHLVGFKQSSIDYEVVYIVRTANYQLHMDLQQKINLELMREFARMGIEFSAPTRVVHLAETPPAASPETAPA